MIEEGRVDASQGFAGQAGVDVIIGLVRENMKALEVVNLLDAPTMEKIEGILANKPEEETDFRNE